MLHPVAGPLLLATVLFLMFQAVFSWATVPMDLIKNGVAALGEIGLRRTCTPGPLQSLLTDGVIGGAAACWCSCRRS